MRRTYALVGQRVCGRRAVRIREWGLTEVTESFDVVIVGARCAGSPLAALLARQGVKVALVERATFPRDTLSTHIFEADALMFLDRLGVTDQLRATGAPFISRLNVRTEDFRVSVQWPQRVGDVGGSASIRRFVLDPILVQAAEDAGAQVQGSNSVLDGMQSRRTANYRWRRAV